MSNREGDRRREPRVTFKYEARVQVGTAILDKEIGTGSLGPLTLHGHTRDLSPSGLGIVIPAADIGPPHSGAHLPARVKVELAGHGVEVEAEAVHWMPLDEVGLGSGVLIGLNVTGGGESLTRLLGAQGAAAPDSVTSGGGDDDARELCRG
jgi:hypothetical protein